MIVACIWGNGAPGKTDGAPGERAAKLFQGQRRLWRQGPNHWSVTLRAAGPNTVSLVLL